MASKCIQALIQARFLWSGIAIAQRRAGKMKVDNEYVSKLANLEPLGNRHISI
jgi:hypothetical protein